MEHGGLTLGGCGGGFLLVGDDQNDPEVTGFEGQELILAPHDIELPLQAVLRRMEALDLARLIVEFGRAVPAVGGKLGVCRSSSGGDHLLAIICRVPSSLLGVTQTVDHLAAFLVLCS